MDDTRHCAETIFANDRQTVGCTVASSTSPPSPILQLEIYLKGGEKRTIEPGAPILDWHFWEDGRKVDVHYGRRVRQGTYTLYESATARVIAKLEAPADERALPQWAKSPAQIEDEAVPTSAALTQERTLWIAKVLRQIEKIEPGMRRKDLGGILTTEGDLSNRFQQTFVSVHKSNRQIQGGKRCDNCLERGPRRHDRFCLAAISSMEHHGLSLGSS